MKSMLLSRTKYFLLGALLMVAGTAFAVQISVPSAPSAGYALVATSTGAYIATTTDPFHVGSIFATSTSQTSTFLGNVALPNLSQGVLYNGTNGLTKSTATSSFTPSTNFTPTGTIGSLVGGTNSTLDLSLTGVTAGTYGTATSTSQVTVDANGRLTAATEVPIAVAGSKAYYAYATQATSSSAYLNMNPVASTTSSTVSYVLSTSPQTVQNWITPVGDPNLSVIPGGNYIIDLFAWRSSGSASITLAVQIWEVSSTGADISLIATTNSTPNLSNTKAQYTVSVTAGPYVMASTASRILMRVIATTTGTPTLSLAMGSTDQMDLVTPGESVTTTNFVPYVGATQTVNLGTFGLIALASSTIGGGGQTTGLTIAGTATTSNLINTNLTSALALFDANHLEGAYSGTTCTNQFVRILSATGVATCSTVSASDVSLANLSATDSTLTFSGTYNGSTARTIGINLANPNTWSALQTINFASTTALTASSELVIPNGASKGSSVAGQIELDTTDDQLKVGDGTSIAVFDRRHFITFTSAATTTAWTGTTTQNQVIAPVAGTINTIQCKTDAGTLNTQIKINSTNLAMFNASTTAGIITFTTSNTFAAGDIIEADYGTPASSPTINRCTAATTLSGT